MQSHRIFLAFRTLLFAFLVTWIGTFVYAQQPLSTQLSQRPIAELARRANVLGNASRGAAVFHRTSIGCTQCHRNGSQRSGIQPTGGPPNANSGSTLGPDLSTLQERATYEHIIESILDPGKEVREGFRPEKLLLDDGRVVAGILRQETDQQLTVMIPGEESPRHIQVDQIEARSPAESIMPRGLANQLESESEFLDLVSYLVTLGKASPAKVQELQKAAAQFTPPPLPGYEKNLDHAGLIRSWNQRSFRNGEAIYTSVCVNCHGTKDEPGSLPNALRFAAERFKNGADPLSMYRTITHGYKMMLPQSQLVPRQKYDVIHYIREKFLKPNNPTQYVEIDAAYLAKLPTGKSRGPEPVQSEPWSEMDYGPFLISTYEITGPDTQRRLGITPEERKRAAREGRPPNETWPENTNFAYKGIAFRLDPGQGGIADGSHFLVFDHDTMRVAGAWSGLGFIDWRGILFNGNHAVTPRTVGQRHFSSMPGPGWANPKDGTFDDPRIRGKDGRQYGPLPRAWAQYHGLYKNGKRTIVSYSVGDAAVLESHRVDFVNQSTLWTRTLNVGPSSNDLALRVAPNDQVNASVTSGLSVANEDDYLVVRIPAKKTPIRLEIHIAEKSHSLDHDGNHRKSESIEDLSQLTHGGEPQWQNVLTTQPAIGQNDGPFAVDTLTRPVDNPWKSRLRMSGVDFFPGGDSLVTCCCDGDVWIVSGINELGSQIQWKRIASGLFHPLGIKIVDGRIFVTCRDQIVVLNDLNGDGETDFYECFNNDHQVTDHFHEFAMGLQSDLDGNLYYAKSARHARDSLVPQHGTLLRVSADGKTTTILANGFRAANGVCLNPDGSFFVTDQEGHWNPMNRINRVVQGGFYGNMYSYGAPDDNSDTAMEQPLCWPNKPFDRSPSELLWVESKKWGPLNKALLNLSYGYGKVFIVLHEQVDGQWQGGMCRIPLPRFPTGVMRARFHPTNGQMYACGMHAWGSDQGASPGGLYRIRYTGIPARLPIGLSATERGITIKFTDPVDEVAAQDKDSFLVETWDLKRSANYGSDRYNEKELDIESVSVSKDGHNVTLNLPDIRPTWCMEISYKLQGTDGVTFQGTIQNTVHRLKAATAKER